MSEEKQLYTWYFTVEKDIPIDAYTEEEAERKFYNKYGSRQILGIIRPIIVCGEQRK